MSAIPKSFIQKTTQLSADVTRAFANARKIYLSGSQANIRVPMREVTQTPTHASQGIEENPPIYIYDTSGPYTDPTAAIDLLKGLPAIRHAWIEQRADTEQLTDDSSAYARARKHDATLAHLRF